jgi:Flp pilus assembly protein CpaB
MRVDVLVAGSISETGLPAAATATVVAHRVKILSVQPAQNGPASAANTSGGTLVVLAVTSRDALALAGGEASGKLSVTLLGD